MKHVTTITVLVITAFVGLYLLMLVLSFLLGTRECRSSLALNNTAMCLKQAVINLLEEDATRP